LKDNYKYVIVGAGAAGYAALEEITDLDPKSHVLIISSEPHLPYSRPALSKDLWDEAFSNPNVGKTLTYRKNSKVNHVSLISEHEWKERFPNVTFASSCEAVDLDVEKQLITLNSGKSVKYDKCLLATGARPNKLSIPGGDGDTDRIITFRNLEDFQKLEEKSAAGMDMVVCGGGFLGTELSSALNKRSKKTGMNLTPRKGKKQRSVTQVHFNRYIIHLY
jgi:programmed cell death 8 (apoptosis-inducing factor)